jgi:hypothetical protein
VTTKNVGFRDKTFDQILINGQETSLTTDMGPQWTPWMAIREFVSNSIDEGEHNIVSSTENIQPREGYTRIYVEHTPEIEAVVNKWDHYFSFDRTDAVLEIGEKRIYPNMDTEKESLLMYRKGIQCYHMTATRSLYSYDLPEYKINESRVLSDTWDAKRDTTLFLSTHATKKIAQNILSNAFTSKEYYEGQMEWGYYGAGTLCQAWRDAIGDYIVVNRDASGFYMTEIGDSGKNHYIVSRRMAKAIKSAFPDVTVYGIGQDDDDTLNWRVIQEPNSKIQYLLKKALEFCKDTEYAVNYPVQVVEFDKPDVLGTIDRKAGTLLVAAKAFDNGSKDVVMTIMEENIHMQENLHDETRAFEQYLIKQWLSEKELRFGVFL